MSNGYAATTVAGIASRAGVVVDTVYATVGRKPALLREVAETAMVLLVHERGWSPQRFTAWHADAWARLLLATPTDPS